MDDSRSALLEIWTKRAKAYRNAHYHASVRLRREHYALGLPTVVLSAVVGTAVFATLEKEVGLGTRIVVGVLSVAAAVLAGMQTFLRFSERAEQHRQAFVEFDAIVREIETALSTPEIDPREATELIRKRFDALGHAPELATTDRRHSDNPPYGRKTSGAPIGRLRASKISPTDPQD